MDNAMGNTWQNHFPLRSFTRIRSGKADAQPRPLYVSRDGVKFIQSHSYFRQIYDVQEYRMQDILMDDVVIDLGANVGAFCIRAARKSGHVAAFEPVTTNLLEQNIRLNNARVRVFEAALGDGHPAWVTWDTCQRLVRTLPLHDMIRYAGGCDVLKCDCEGAEWMIAPGDLSGIRRIEMELHQPPIGPRPNSCLLDYISKNYEFVIDRIPVYAPLGQMGVLHAWRKN
jgi:FkbM family methyltransferase